jgi:hypothetical protein
MYGRKIIQDTREQQPWEFSKRAWPDGVEVKGLLTGDYTLAGLEETFTADRKGKVTELASNLVRDRFVRELERMEGIAHPFVVCDFSLNELLDYPRVASVPHYLRRKIRLRGPFLVSKLNEFMLKYRARWVFADGRGRDLVLSMLKRVAGLYPLISHEA